MAGQTVAAVRAGQIGAAGGRAAGAGQLALVDVRAAGAERVRVAGIAGRTGARVVAGRVQAVGVRAARVGSFAFVDVCVAACGDGSERLANSVSGAGFSAVLLTGAIFFTVALESGVTLAHEMRGQVAAFGVGHASGGNGGILAFVNVCV